MKIKVDLKDPVKAALIQVLRTLCEGLEFTEELAGADLVILGDVRQALPPLKAGKYVALLLLPRDMPTAFGLTSAPLYSGKVEAFTYGLPLQPVTPLVMWIARIRKEISK